MKIYFGLGSNQENELGTPLWHMQQAVKKLQALSNTDITVSSLYKSLPMGPDDQPNYLNAVVGLDFCEQTAQKYPPLTLLTYTQNIEQQANRQKKRHWGERTIDVDILIYGNQIVNTKALTIPHAGLLQRNFVLVPLLEIAPNLFINNQAISSIPMAHDKTGLELIKQQWT